MIFASKPGFTSILAVVLLFNIVIIYVYYMSSGTLESDLIQSREYASKLKAELQALTDDRDSKVESANDDLKRTKASLDSATLSIEKLKSQVATLEQSKNSADTTSNHDDDDGGGSSIDDVRRKNFERIYDTSMWGGDGKATSKSGSGSNVDNTKGIRKLLKYFLPKYEIKTFMDAPCGDYHWQHLVKEFDDVLYTGADIVKSLVDRHQKNNLSNAKRRFLQFDMVIDTLPKDTFDVVMARDVIQHLPLEDGLKFYKNIEQSGAKYLITTFHYPSKNNDIGPGAYYPNNPMDGEFFNFGKPILYTREHADLASDAKYIGVFELPIVGKGNRVSLEPVPESRYKVVDTDGKIVFDGEIP